MKSTVSVGPSVNSSRFSHLDALLDKFFQTNKCNKKRQEAIIPLTTVDASKQPNTQESQQQLSQNNVYVYSSSSDSDSDDNIIEQFYSKSRPETSVTVSQQSQQQQLSQNAFVNTCLSENLKISEKQPLSYEQSIDRASSNKYADQLQDQSSSKSAKKQSPETQSIQEIFSQGPMQKYKLQCGPNYNFDEQKQLKYLNYTAKIIEGLKSQQNQDTCGQKKIEIQNSQIPYFSSTSSCLNNQLPTICSKKDNPNQNNQVEKSYSQFSNTPPLQQYPQEDIEGEVECDKNTSLRKKLSSNSKESLNSKGQSSDSKTQPPDAKCDQGEESLMGSSFTLRKVSQKQNNFEKISRQIFLQGQEESDDDEDEDGDEMEALKAIAKKYQQQERRKVIKETSLDDSVSIIPCMNDITQILNQFQDKDKTTREEQEIKNEKMTNNARKLLKSKPIQKPERINGRVSDIKKLSECKTTTTNAKRTRYQFYDEEEENILHWNGGDNDDGEESSSDCFESDFDAGFKGKDKNSFMKISNDPKTQKKQGYVSKDPKKKICLEKHKTRVESSEEEDRKANRQNVPTKPQRSSSTTMAASLLQQNQVKRNLNNPSNFMNRFSGGNAMVSECKRRELKDPKILCHKQQEKKGKKKQIVDSDEEFEAEMNRQKNLKKQKRDTRKIHKYEESSYSEQSQQIKEYNEEDDEEDIRFDGNFQYEERENIKREITIQKSNLLDRRRLQLDSQRSLAQQQSQSQSKLSQLLSQKQRISQFSQNFCQSAASPSPSSQRMPMQQSQDIEKGEKKIKKKLVKAAHIEDFATFQCTICLDQPADPFFGEIDCQHRFCFQCILNWSKVTNQCPMCRTEFSQILKRNFNGTVTKNQPLTFVRRRKQKIHESYYLEEAQALQDEEDRQAGQQQQANTEPAVCYKCLRSENQNLLLICDVCDENYCHTFCDETLTSRRVPEGRWACHSCRF